jgi:hypothetical protein
MTTNDLIALILKDHYNADSLAQLATAIECLQEQMADVAIARERALLTQQAIEYEVLIQEKIAAESDALDHQIQFSGPFFELAK